MFKLFFYSLMLIGGVASAQSQPEPRIQYGYREMQVTYKGKTWVGKVSDGDLKTKVVLGHYLTVESVVSGALTVVFTQLFDLNTGHEVFDLAAGIISNNGRELILMPSDVAISWWNYSPTIYTFKSGETNYNKASYDLKARLGCGSNYDLTTPANDYKFTKSTIEFTRNDSCGQFKVSFPRP